MTDTKKNVLLVVDGQYFPTHHYADALSEEGHKVEILSYKEMQNRVEQAAPHQSQPADLVIFADCEEAPPLKADDIVAPHAPIAGATSLAKQTRLKFLNTAIICMPTGTDVADEMKKKLNGQRVTVLSAEEYTPYRLQEFVQAQCFSKAL